VHCSPADKELALSVALRWVEIVESDRRDEA
jgi:hypothetical protein